MVLCVHGLGQARQSLASCGQSAGHKLCANLNTVCMQQVLNILEHMYDNPGAAPRQVLGRLLYGRDSVFARTPTPNQIAAITSADVAAHLATWQRPDAAVLGIAGEFAVTAFPILLSICFKAHHHKNVSADTVY